MNQEQLKHLSEIIGPAKAAEVGALPWAQILSVLTSLLGGVNWTSVISFILSLFATPVVTPTKPL